MQIHEINNNNINYYYYYYNKTQHKNAHITQSNITLKAQHTKLYKQIMQHNIGGPY
jgi:hypothetical protein